MAEKYGSYSPYHFSGNNLMAFVDFNGAEFTGPSMQNSEFKQRARQSGSELDGFYSTHIDNNGKVITEYDDGDNGVYVHNSGTTKSEIDKQRKDGKNTGGEGNYIGELGGVLDITEITKNILANNKLEAINLGLIGWLFNVLPGRKWDYKMNKRTIFGVAWADGEKTRKHTRFTAGDLTFEHAADFGNYNAGYTGTLAGINSNEQYTWAGLGEVAKFDNMIGRLGEIISNTVPYGDMPQDFQKNTQGMKRGSAENVRDRRWNGGVMSEKIKTIGPY